MEHETPPAMNGDFEAASMTGEAPAGPVAEHERIITLDVLRGFALFGILMVNMQFFAMPFMRALFDPSLADAPAGDQLAWGVVKVFFEYKFVSLFSLMFGMGLAVQLLRSQRANRPFAPMYLRRLGVLALIGGLHAVLLWYGDILLFYAGIGLVLLMFARFSAKALVALAAAAFAVGVLLVGGMTIVQVFMVEHVAAQQAAVEAAVIEAEGELPAEDAPAPDERDAEASETATEQEPVLPLRGLDAVKAAHGDPNHDLWIEAEIAAFKEGPFSHATLFRVIIFSYALIFGLLGFLWHVLAMFCLGAALLKMDFFGEHRRAWHVRFALLGLGIGLPLECAGAWMQHAAEYDFGRHFLFIAFMHEFGSVATALGYLGVICLIVSSGAMRFITGAIASVGRMALTNYLGQTVIATSLMYWWGLGWFNDVSRSQQIGLVVLIFLAQIIFSVFWLRTFRFGPMEWLWRSLTYMKWQPLMR